MIADASTIATVRFWLSDPLPLDRNDLGLEFSDADLIFLIEQSDYVEQAIALGWLKRAQKADAFSGSGATGGAITELQIGNERVRYSDSAAATTGRKGAYFWYEYWLGKVPGQTLPDDEIALQIATPDVAGLLPEAPSIYDPDTVYRDRSIASYLP